MGLARARRELAARPTIVADAPRRAERIAVGSSHGDCARAAYQTPNVKECYGADGWAGAASSGKAARLHEAVQAAWRCAGSHAFCARYRSLPAPARQSQGVFLRRCCLPAATSTTAGARRRPASRRPTGSIVRAWARAPGSRCVGGLQLPQQRRAPGKRAALPSNAGHTDPLPLHFLSSPFLLVSSSNLQTTELEAQVAALQAEAAQLQQQFGAAQQEVAAANEAERAARIALNNGKRKQARRVTEVSVGMLWAYWRCTRRPRATPKLCQREALASHKTCPAATSPSPCSGKPERR